ncbi:MAG: glycosyltransferase family 2 protein [Lachnospiraceae bacterium]|nr:glycosyltransferase family 2 protein [Lachnospiraceae bacterium]
MDNLYIVIPAYNEQDTIREVINQWYPIVEKIGNNSRLVIVNDGSKDDTYKIMQKCAKEKPLFVPLTKENEGHGATVLFAYNYALDQKADYIFQTDSDGQTIPDEFWTFWEQRHDYDLVIGHRNHRQDGFSRVVVTKILKMVIRICFGVNVIDANTPFRLMEADTLRDNIQLIPPNFNLSNVILSVIYERKKSKIKYIPITFQQRQGGINSINLLNISKIGLQALKDFRHINRSLEQYNI